MPCEKVKMDVNFQDREVPIYIDFGIIESPAVLCGINIKNCHPLPGKIMDRGGNEMTYMPHLSTTNTLEVFDKMRRLPKNSLVWLLGELEDNSFYVFDGGNRKDFQHPAVLDKLIAEFKGFLDPEVFTYCGRTCDGIYFDVKGKAKKERIEGRSSDSVVITNRDNNVVGFIAENKEKFVPFDGKLINFRALVAEEYMKRNIKALQPHI